MRTAVTAICGEERLELALCGDDGAAAREDRAAQQMRVQRAFLRRQAQRRRQAVFDLGP
jgi:hypothetical protein